MSSRTLPLIRGFLVMLVAGFALSGIIGMFGASDRLAPLGMPPAFVKRSIVAVIDTARQPKQREASAPRSSAEAPKPAQPAAQPVVPTPAVSSSGTETAPPSVPKTAPSTPSGSPSQPAAPSQNTSAGASGETAGQFVPVAGATCVGCRVTQGTDGSIGATIPGEGNVTDSAYALLDFGGTTGVTGPLFVRESLALGAGQTPAGDLHVAQVTDVANRVVYRLEISGGSRALRLTSPPGGLSADAIDIDTGAVVPNDGSSSVRVSVSFDPKGLLVLRVNGQEVVRRTDLAGASTGPSRYLAAGIVASDPGSSGGGTAEITVVHSGITAGPAAPGGGAPATTPPPKLAPQPPAKVAVPSPVTEPTLVSPVAAAGAPVTAQLGVWSDPKAQLTAQWERCDAAGKQCTAIAGATAPTYTATNADVGLTLRIRVDATNSAGTGTAFSASSDPVLTAGVPVVVTPPAISGTAVAGSVLTGAPGTWTDATGFGFAWERCDATGANCAAIPGATQTTYQLVAADVGSTVRLVVTATGRTATSSAASTPTAVVAVAAPTVVTLPSISGTATEGSKLVASPGVWSDPNAHLTFAWLRCNSTGTCTPIDGANGSSYLLTTADVGLTIEVVVTATNATGTGSATSAPTAVVTAAAPPPPDNGGGTPPPDNGGGTPPPDNGGGTPPPDNGGGTPPPDTGGGTPPPDNVGGTPPANDQGTPPSDEGTSPGDEGTSGGNAGASPVAPNTSSSSSGG